MKLKPYIMTDWEDHIVDPLDGEILQQGTPLSARNLNKMEQGIYDAYAYFLLMGNDFANLLKDIERLYKLIKLKPLDESDYDDEFFFIMHIDGCMFTTDYGDAMVIDGKDFSIQYNVKKSIDASGFDAEYFLDTGTWGNIKFSGLSETPTTLFGYGITDAQSINADIDGGAF